MASLNTLNITNSGFININEKVVNSRIYSSNLITAVGTPIVTNGIASGFSSNSYFTYSNLNFNESEQIDINFKGNFIANSDKQCAFQLLTDSGIPLSLYFENDRVTLSFENYIIFTFGNLISLNNSDISMFIIIRNTNFEFTMNYGKEVIQKSGAIDIKLPLSSFKTLFLGNNSINKNQAWYNNINLKDLSIYNNKTLIYTPSVGTSWNFSNILVSDGEFPLTDKTQSVAGHIFNFPVTKIAQSGNTVLLTCEISEDSYLTIKEIGIYIQTPGGKILFGLITNLNINKEKNLTYDLIFTVNTTINVVNAIGFPAENGIVVEDPDFVEFKDYTTVQQVNTYVLTNLERIIRMNAGAKGSYDNHAIKNAQAGIGYNRPQVIYRLQQEIENAENCYNSMDTFVKLTNRFRKVVEEQVDFEEIEIEGNLQVPENGVIQGFSTTDYISRSTPFMNSSAWAFNSTFTSGKVSTTGTIASLSNSSPHTPLELGVLNNQCYLKIRSLESINPTNLNSYYTRNASSDSQLGALSLYAWERVKNTSLYNFHCNNLALSNSSIINFPQVTPLIMEHESMDSSSFTFSVRTLITNLTTTQYIIGKTSANVDQGFELFIEDGKIKVNLYEDTSGDLIGVLSTRFNLKVNHFYNIRLSYDGSKYSLYYKKEPVGSEYIDEETETLISNHLISLSNTVNLVIGAQYSTDSQYLYQGSIDFSEIALSSYGLSWNGCSDLTTIYTETPTPSDLSVTYDNDFYEIPNSLAEDYEGNYIINTNNLFTIEDHTKYTVSISYSENDETEEGTYEVKLIVNDLSTTERTILSETLPISENLNNRMSLPSATFVGVTSAATISNPFSATINLMDWEVSQGEINWPFKKEVILNSTELLQCYNSPNYNKNQYATKDLCNLVRKLKFLSNKFTGNEDIIDFSYKEGLTLCMKVALADAEPKVLLYKSDLVNDIYFSLTFIDQTLTFTLTTKDGNYSLSKSLTLPEYASYTDEPIMITVTFTPQFDNWGYLQMYKNNDPITEPQYVQLDPTIDPSIFILSNYLTSSDSKHVGRYLRDLVVIKGVISIKDLKYINNLFDTNY